MYTGHGQATVCIHVKETHDTDHILIFSLGFLYVIIFLLSFAYELSRLWAKHLCSSCCMKNDRNQLSDQS